MSHNKFKAGETQGTYVLTEPATAEEILAMANRLARARVTKGKALTSPSLTYSCLQTLLQGYEREVFAILFLDSQHRVIKFEELFQDLKRLTLLKSSFLLCFLKSLFQLLHTKIYFLTHHPMKITLLFLFQA